MSSWRAESYSRVSLVSGQTRSSRSFGSMRVASTGWGASPWGETLVSADILQILLQRRIGADAATSEFDFGECDENFRAGLEIRRFEERLLLAHAEGAHHAKRIPQRLVGSLFDAPPIHLH